MPFGAALLAARHKAARLSNPERRDRPQRLTECAPPFGVGIASKSHNPLSAVQQPVIGPVLAENEVATLVSAGAVDVMHFDTFW